MKDEVQILSDLMSKILAGEMSVDEAKQKASEIVTGRPKGCIYKQGRLFWVKYFYHGKARFESTKSGDRRVAEELLIQREKEAEDEKLPNFQAQKTKFNELAEGYLMDYRLKDRKTLIRAK